MALFIKQDERRSELQQRIAAELQEKARKKAADSERPDGVDDSAFIKGSKQTTSLMGVWVLIGIFVIAAIIAIIVAAT